VVILVGEQSGESLCRGITLIHDRSDGLVGLM
jgi:hypothetical protein